MKVKGYNKTNCTLDLSIQEVGIIFHGLHSLNKELIKKQHLNISIDYVTLINLIGKFFILGIKIIKLNKKIKLSNIIYLKNLPFAGRYDYKRPFERPPTSPSSGDAA